MNLFIVFAFASSDVAPGLPGIHTAGGPDGYGYTFTDSDESGGPVFNWVDASGGTSYSLNDDDNVLVSLPFNFPFYDTVLNQIYIVSNGFLTSSNTTDFSNDSLPDSNKNNIIAPFWDDLAPNNGGNVYTYYDSSGTGAFVIAWVNVPHFSSGGPYTFEVLLFPDGNILFQYLDLDEGLVNSSTIGIQGGDGSSNYYLQYTYNGNPVVPHDSLAILFTRPSWNHNVGVTSVSPEGIVDPDVPVDISASIVNMGSSDETFDVYAVITDENTGDTLFNQSSSLTLISGGDTTILMGQFTPDSNMIYRLTVFTALSGDEYPGNDTMSTVFRTAMIAGDVLAVIDAGAVIGDNQLLGVEFDGEHFYITGGNSASDPNKVYVLDTAGNLLCSVDQPSHSTSWGWRDLASDGDTLYASVDNNVDKFTIDLGTCTLTYHGNFPGPENPNRALAYRHSDGHFFTANFNSSIYEFDKSNSSINSWTNSYSIYGAAYDPITGKLWFATQETNTHGDYNFLREFDPTSGSYTGTALEPSPATWSSGAYAGGLDIGTFRGKRALIELLQASPSDLIVIMYLGSEVANREGVNRGIFDVHVNPKGGFISLQVNNSAFISVDLYTINGRRVFHVDGRYTPGKYTFEPGSLTSGVYILKAQSGNVNFIRKLVIMR